MPHGPLPRRGETPPQRPGDDMARQVATRPGPSDRTSEAVATERAVRTDRGCLHQWDAGNARGHGNRTVDQDAAMKSEHPARSLSKDFEVIPPVGRSVIQDSPQQVDDYANRAPDHRLSAAPGPRGLDKKQHWDQAR